MRTEGDARRRTAETIARRAGEVARRHFRDLGALEVETKGRQDYVSRADREVEQVIREALAREFPGEGFLGEETGGEIAEPMWVVDPIDGTTNFLRGIPMFAISMAWVAEGRTQVGVVYEPATDKMYSATSDGPATLDGRPLSVRPCPGLEEAIVAFGYSERSGREPFLERFPRVLRAHAEFRRLGAATIGLVSVAAGQTDAFFQLHLSPWDVLAGLLIVERAGGVTKDFLARDGLRKGNVTFCAAPGIAEDLAQLLEVELP
jgi:myo-inositol-1(or 4)-monophosphatase